MLVLLQGIRTPVKLKHSECPKHQPWKRDLRETEQKQAQTPQQRVNKSMLPVTTRTKPIKTSLLDSTEEARDPRIYKRTKIKRKTKQGLNKSRVSVSDSQGDVN